MKYKIKGEQSRVEPEITVSLEMQAANCVMVATMDGKEYNICFLDSKGNLQLTYGVPEKFGFKLDGSMIRVIK